MEKSHEHETTCEQQMFKKQEKKIESHYFTRLRSETSASVAVT